MIFQLSKPFKRVGSLALTALLLAACGNDTVTISPTTAAATTAAATTAITTAVAPTTVIIATTAPATTVAATSGATAVATAGAVSAVTPTATSGTGSTTPTPSPIAGIGTPSVTTAPGSPVTPGGTPGALTAANTTATQTAQGDLKDASGNTLGRVFLAQGDFGVKVVLTYNGLVAGDHGIHFHAVGKCEGPDFASAGAHFNPENKKHGLLSPAGSHAGDMPDLIVSASRTGIYEATTSLFNLGNGPEQLIGQFGAALVIHANPDDQMTDPTGNSGGRMACAVLTSNAPSVNSGPGATAAPGITPVSGTPGAGATVSPGATVTVGTPGATTVRPTTAGTTAGTGTATGGSTPTPAPTR